MIPKIEVFVRHCHFSAISHSKKRFETFSKQRCFENLMRTADFNKINLTFFLDTFYPTDEKHFVTMQNSHPVITISEGTETGSFLKLLDHVQSLSLADDTIIYFLEDDYIHKEGWVDILLEGFTLQSAEYVTLYDHKDKYFAPSYAKLQSKIFHTHSCHWRTTPSTTNTYAMRFKTLKKHFKIHQEFSLGRKISADHAKFCKLAKKGSCLISPIPGWATHAEPEFASPCTNWNQLLDPIPRA